MSKEDKQRRRLLAQQAAQQHLQSGTFQITASGTHYSGPLPHPDILVKYNEAHPGAADRIIAMAEQQSAHRQEIEKKVIASNCHVQKSGPIFGFIVCMTAIIGGVYLIHSGQQAGGLVSIISALSGLAVVFVYGKKKQKEDLQQKLAALVKSGQSA